MAGFGPPPKHPSQRRRRNAPLAGNAMRRLPANGREGPAPAWPWKLQTKEEKSLWALLWKKPQATVWEEIECADIVARYTRYYASGNTSLATEVRQLEDRLGLSPMAMLRLRWEIDIDETQAEEEAAPEGAIDIRARLLAVAE